MSYKPGDRVICTKIWDSNKDIVGKMGTITWIGSTPTSRGADCAVDFDEIIVSGHPARGCRVHHGWYISFDCIQLINMVFRKGDMVKGKNVVGVVKSTTNKGIFIEGLNTEILNDDVVLVGRQKLI